MQATWNIRKIPKIYRGYKNFFYNLCFSFQVNMQSLSEAAGLKPGDTILAVNGRDLSGLRHKEAQEAIVKSGNNFSLTILRWVNLKKLVFIVKIFTYVI